MPTIDETLIRLNADVLLLEQKLRRGDRAIEGSVRRADRQLDRFDRRFQRSFQALGRSFGGVNLTRALGPLAAAGGAAAFTRGTEAALKQADAIAKIADSAGISTAALQEYRFAAELSGVSSEKFDSAVQGLAKRMGELRSGTGSLLEFLKKNNEELANSLAGARSTEEALDILFRAMDQTGSQFDRAALAAAAFGRSAGVDMTNLLRGGIDSIDEMRSQARRTGAVLQDSLIRQAEKLNDEMFAVSQVIDVNFKTALLSTAPALQDFKLFLSEVLVGLGDFFALLGVGPDTIRKTGVELVVISQQLKTLEDQLANVGQASSGFDFPGADQAANEAAQRLAIEEKINALLERRAELQEQLKGLLAPPSAEGFGSDSGEDSGAASSPRIDTFQKDLQSLVDRLDPAGAALRKFDEDLALLERGQGQLGSERFEALKEALEAEKFEELRGRLEDLNIELDRGDELIDEYRAAFDLLWAALQAGIISAEQFEELIAKINDRLVEGANKTGDLSGSMAELEDVGRDVGQALADSFVDVIENINDAGDALRSFLLQLSRIGFQAFVAGPLTGFLSGLGASAAGAKDGGLVRAAGGGLIRGPGTGTSDSILARVSNREFIMPAEATARNLPALEAMRQGASLGDILAKQSAALAGLPRFAAGGQAGGSPPAASMAGTGGALSVTLNQRFTIAPGADEKDARRTAQQAARSAGRFLQNELRRAGGA